MSQIYAGVITAVFLECFDSLKWALKVTETQHQMFSVDSVFHLVVVSLIIPCLDYGNTTLAELPASQLHHLQLVLNAATRLIHRSSRYEHVTPIHWLRSPECINFKLAVLVYRCLYGLVATSEL